MLVIIVAALSSFALSVLITAFLIKWLRMRGEVVEDFQKPSHPLIPRPAGPAVIVAMVTGFLLLYLGGHWEALAAAFIVLIAGLIGLVDDFRALGGLVKPLLLLPAALPLIAFHAYDPRLTLPLFGTVRLTVIYPILVLLAITVTANTVNTIDVLNGVVSAFVALASLPLLVAFYLKGSQVGLGLAAVMMSASLGLYVYHRYPSKIFPGDSGTMALGAAYGAIVIIGGAEVVGVVALLPAILNSFFFLSSVKRLVEHREVPRPGKVRDDGLLEASRDRQAPITLLRLILADGPLDERESAKKIIYLTAYSAVLAGLTAAATWLVRLHR